MMLRGSSRIGMPMQSGFRSGWTASRRTSAIILGQRLANQVMDVLETLVKGGLRQGLDRAASEGERRHWDDPLDHSQCPRPQAAGTGAIRVQRPPA